MDFFFLVGFGSSMTNIFLPSAALQRRSMLMQAVQSTKKIVHVFVQLPWCLLVRASSSLHTTTANPPVHNSSNIPTITSILHPPQPLISATKVTTIHYISTHTSTSPVPITFSHLLVFGRTPWIQGDLNSWPKYNFHIFFFTYNTHHTLLLHHLTNIMILIALELCHLNSHWNCQ